MPKPHPEEVWRQLADEAGDGPVDNATQVSIAQAEQELAAAGFDVAAERAKAEALLREMEAAPQLPEATAIAAGRHESKDGEGRSRERRRPRSVVRVLAVAAVLAIAAGAVLYFAARGSSDNVASPRPGSSSIGSAPKPREGGL